jgi:hypothetical protein
MNNTKNIEEIVEGGGIELVMQCLELHAEHPLVLAKAFWALVNMSLYDPFKDKIVGGGGIQKIVAAMRRFPDHIELQYRSCFALINLCIKMVVKDLVRELDGIRLVIDGMTRFPKHLLFQRCACVVLRSLAWNSSANGRMIRDLDGPVCIRAMMENFSQDEKMVHLGSTALNCIYLDVPNHLGH